jgi:Sec-independent protein translocase protein TatA
MFGIGPIELALFLVIVLLAVGPERLPTFMRTLGRGLRQVRNASREFKEAIGLDELMREGDPFRAPPVRPPRARPVPIPKASPESSESLESPESPESSESPESPTSPVSPTVPPPVPEAVRASTITRSVLEDGEVVSSVEPDSSSETERP